ncbi:MAG: aldo/keto reductase [Bacillota bacterium]
MSLPQVPLGNTGLMVSRFCFGTLTIGPWQANLPLPEGAALIRRALEAGVNFIDTAELYRTYDYIRLALGAWPEPVVIATKSYAVSARQMEESLAAAQRGLNRDQVEVFLLHEQESALTLRGHGDALRVLVRAKEQGIIKAIGISTHCVAGVRAAITHPEIDVIHPLVNVAGLGIADGTREEMVQAISEARAVGKGVYLMKPLGGGNLLPRAVEALQYAVTAPADAVAVGVKTAAELDFDLSFFQPGKRPAAPPITGKRLRVEPYCRACGECGRACPTGAIAVQGGRAKVDHTRCILCGYCAARCPEFCLRVY